MARVIGSPPMSRGKHRPCNSLSSSWFWFDAVFGVSITLYVESRARTRLGRNEGGEGGETVLTCRIRDGTSVPACVQRRRARDVDMTV